MFTALLATIVLGQAVADEPSAEDLRLFKKWAADNRTAMGEPRTPEANAKFASARKLPTPNRKPEEKAKTLRQLVDLVERGVKGNWPTERPEDLKLAKECLPRMARVWAVQTAITQQIFELDEDEVGDPEKAIFSNWSDDPTRARYVHCSFPVESQFCKAAVARGTLCARLAVAK